MSTSSRARGPTISAMPRGVSADRRNTPRELGTDQTLVHDHVVERFSGKNLRTDGLRVGNEEMSRLERGSTICLRHTSIMHASKSTGRELSYSINSFILAGRSAALSHRIAWTPIDFASVTKSGFDITPYGWRAL